MKILVDEIPSNCHNCSFVGEFLGWYLALKGFEIVPKPKVVSGCKLLNVKISDDLEFSGRHYKCPLREVFKDANA